MVSRIGTAAHNQALVQQMLLAQTRVSDTQMQVGTEKKSQTYKGISTDSFRLISLENERLRMEQYVKNNAIADTNAKAMVTTVESMDEVIRLLRSELIGFTSRDLSDASPEDTMAVTNIQERAFSALNDMEFFLNLQVDGKYLFAGGKTNSPPVTVPYNNVAEFQADYDGINTTYAETRTAHLSQAKFTGITAAYTQETFDLKGTSTAVTRITGAAGDFITATLDESTFGDLTFANVGVNGTITSSVQGAYSNLTVGQTILVNGTEGATNNNGVYTITAVSGDGTQITLDQTLNVGAAAAAASAVNINLAVPDGTTVFLSGTDVTNDGSYTVRWPTNAEIAAAAPQPALNMNAGAPPPVVDGRVIWVTGQVNNISGETITLDAAPYYRGDRLEVEHRVNDNRAIRFGVNGLDPAFEKAIRGLGQLLQGDLINNQTRAVDALGLINDAIEHSPLSTEQASDLQDVAQRLALNQKIIFDAKQDMIEFNSFLGQRQIQLENVDVTEAAVRLQDDVRALEISFATLARVQQLSLATFI
ncbi:MAG: hypothetical protein ACJZ9F_12735 [Rhodospirillaceae bacterium]